MSSKREGRRPEIGLELPFGHLIRGITRSRNLVEREEAAAAYLLALAAQRHVERPEDRLAVAAMATRTRKELLGHAVPGGRGSALGDLAAALIGGSTWACAEALLALVAWYEQRGRFAEGCEISEVADGVPTGTDAPELALRALEVHGSLALQCGRLGAALGAFRRLERAARDQGGDDRAVRAALGVARVELARGRVSRARLRASRALADAARARDAELVGLCHHTLFAIEQQTRNLPRALESGWEALRAYGRSPSGAHVLVECAQLFAALGERATARRAFEAALQHPLTMRTRLAAMIGLLDLEVVEGNQVAFRARRKALESDPELDEVPLWQTQFWVAVARGLRRFGQHPAAQRALDEAVWLAEWNGLGPSGLDADPLAEGDAVATSGRNAPRDEEMARTVEEYARRFGGAELA